MILAYLIPKCKPQKWKRPENTKARSRSSKYLPKPDKGGFALKNE
jgi:hypothetical protein